MFAIAFQRFIILATFLLLTCSVFAQEDEKDTYKYRRGFLFPFSYKIQLPAADLAQRFGTNFSIGSGVHLKSEQNWIYGIEASYLFGSVIRQESLLNSYLYHNTGFIIDNTGRPANVVFNERGWTATIRIGKLLPLHPTNKESGLILQGGIGILQHQLQVDLRGYNVPLLEGPYLAGIDRLSNGISLVQNIGYLHLDSRRLINFAISFEAYQAFTRNRRIYNFDEGRTDQDLRVDLLFGVRFTWILPVYRQHKNQFFYN